MMGIMHKLLWVMVAGALWQLLVGIWDYFHGSGSLRVLIIYTGFCSFSVLMVWKVVPWLDRWARGDE